MFNVGFGNILFFTHDEITSKTSCPFSHRWNKLYDFPWEDLKRKEKRKQWKHRTSSNLISIKNMMFDRILSSIGTEWGFAYPFYLKFWMFFITSWKHPTLIGWLKYFSHTLFHVFLACKTDWWGKNTGLKLRAFPENTPDSLMVRHQENHCQPAAKYESGFGLCIIFLSIEKGLFRIESLQGKEGDLASNCKFSGRLEVWFQHWPPGKTLKVMQLPCEAPGCHQWSLSYCLVYLMALHCPQRAESYIYWCFIYIPGKR